MNRRVIFLTDRERQVLELRSKGKLASEIATELTISVHTVRKHYDKIRDKLDAKDILAAVLMYVEATTGRTPR